MVGLNYNIVELNCNKTELFCINARLKKNSVVPNQMKEELI